MNMLKTLLCLTLTCATLFFTSKWVFPQQRAGNCVGGRCLPDHSAPPNETSSPTVQENSPRFDADGLLRD
jgi:hypothetical protein